MLTHVVAAWRTGLNPDNHVAPYVTSLADALGTTVLVASASLAIR